MGGFSDNFKLSDSVVMELAPATRKTLVGINTLANIDQWVYANHMPFFFDLGRVKEQTGNKFILFAPPRMSIDRMRNEAARMALEQEFTHLMFIDDDVLVPDTAYRQLVERDKDIIAGVTYIRSPPFEPMIFNFSREAPKSYLWTDFEESVDENGLLACDALGFSCVLIKVSLLKKLPPPFFVTGVNHTEDVYFCKKAKEFFPETSIFIDNKVQTEHKMGTEFISKENLEFWRDYLESVKKPKENTGDRGNEYLEKNTLIYEI